MSQHHFDIGDAEKYGVAAAVILNNIRFWVAHSAANNKNKHEGRHWTYNSVRAFSDLFPYLTARQIRHALDKLEEAGEIKSGNFNKTGYDRTKWYTCQIDLTSVSNGSDRDVEPIPDINTDTNTDINTDSSGMDLEIDKTENGMSEMINDLDTDDFGMWWAAYPRQVNQKKAKDAYMAASRKVDRATLLRAAEGYAKEVKGRDKEYITMPARFLQDELWDDYDKSKRRPYMLDGEERMLTEEEADYLGAYKKGEG
jgi:hypothetical protein